MMATGQPVSGPLLRIQGRVEAKEIAQAKVTRGAVVLLEHVPADKQAMQWIRPLWRAGAGRCLWRKTRRRRSI